MKHSEWHDVVVIKPSVLLQPSPGCKNSTNGNRWNNMKQKLNCWYVFEWGISMLTTYCLLGNLWLHRWLHWNSAIFRYYTGGDILRTWNSYILKKKKINYFTVLTEKEQEVHSSMTDTEIHDDSWFNSNHLSRNESQTENGGCYRNCQLSPSWDSLLSPHREYCGMIVVSK